MNPERIARWVVQGMSSGEPMRLDLTLCVLNEILRLDKEAANKLVTHRFECNQQLAEHPTIPVFTENGVDKIGLLGVINGILKKEDPTGSGICAIIDTDTKKVVGFDLIPFEEVKFDE